jgi:hypothetical protein
MPSNQHSGTGEADWSQQPTNLAPSRFMIGQDGEPMVTVQPVETIIRRFSSRPTLGDAGFIRTGGGTFQHQAPKGENL